MKERGNILFLILLAIILFVALSYAVNSGMRGGGKTGSGEKAQAQVSSILNFLDLMSSTVMRMTVSGGIKPDTISFSYNYKQQDGTVTVGGFANPNCLTNECGIFKTGGGGVSSQTFETYGHPDPTGITGTSTMPGYYQFLLMQFPYAGTALNDIVMRIVYLNTAVCDEIAARLSLPTDTSITGTYTSASNPANWDNAGYTVSTAIEPYLGKNTWLTYHGSGSGRYCHVGRLLIAR